MIPARNCILSPMNVRRTPIDPATTAQFKADVQERGILQNLIGFAIQKKLGKFEITAGGRRLGAVHELIADKIFGDDYALPVFVLNDTSAAAEISLAENFQREAMNPADECIAFRHFIDAEGKTAEDVARRFGLSTRFVEGRIRLAGLAEEIFEALQKGEITLEVAQAFGTTSDVARQSALYAQMKGGYYGFNAANIRRAMMSETITGNTPTAKFVGRDAYVAAGGRIEADLFADEGDEIWLDTVLVSTLAEAKMAEAAAAVTGFANVVPVLGNRPTYDLTEGLRPLRGKLAEPTEAEQERLTVIETEIEAIMEAADGDDQLSDEDDEKVEALQAEAHRITNRDADIDDEANAKATAYIVIGTDGTPVLHETFYVEPTIASEDSGSTRTRDAEAADVGAPALGKPIRDELAVVRIKLLGLHIANDPGFAVDLMVFNLADAQVKPGTSTERASSLQGGAPGRAPFDYKPEGAIIDEMTAFAERLDYSWAEHRKAADRCDAFRALDDDSRGAWAGWMMARTLEPKLADETGAAFHNHLGRSLGIDVAAWWRPTAANFFNRVCKGVVLDALTAIGGPDLKNRYAAAKKGDLAAAVEKLCAGNAIVEAEIRTVAVAWVLEVMTFGTADEPEAIEGDTDTHGGDETPGDDEAPGEDADPVDDSDDDTIAASRVDALDEAA